eukprot:TRINITY_DN74826_c0_g1_i11.p6 TRINITY_DN74826_c0_g1~~TRINITY_DN74826_c0_g1_i11.p6  ORF type:complete len:131 (-),score=17.41 TRINITY_DN74826_c0_g1_i11:988-1380(-)
MGCLNSKQPKTKEVTTSYKGDQYYSQRTKNYSKPKWKSNEKVTLADLTRMRDTFWDTQPHYGGSREIWDALKAASEATDIETTRLIIEAAGIIVTSPDLSVCYDEKGAKYELPNYVWSAPSNLKKSDNAI